MTYLFALVIQYFESSVDYMYVYKSSEEIEWEKVIELSTMTMLFRRISRIKYFVAEIQISILIFILYVLIWHK